MKHFLILILFSITSLFSADFQEKIAAGIPLWMERQIEKDLEFFQNRTLSLKQLDSLYHKKGAYLQVAKFTIQNNTVSADDRYLEPAIHKPRVSRYMQAIGKLCSAVGMPDMVF